MQKEPPTEAGGSETVESGLFVLDKAGLLIDNADDY